MTTLPSRWATARQIPAGGKLAAVGVLLLAAGCATTDSRDSMALPDAIEDACLNRQYASLRRSLGEEVESFELRQRGEQLILRWPGDLAFDTGSADIAPAAESVLAALVQTLGECDSTSVRIVGHTDAVGSEQTNAELSIRRAQGVADALVSRGVDSARLRVEGAGEDRPIATNTTSEGRTLNRRVEIEITPAG